MDRAVRAGRFFKPVGALLQPDFGIVQEFLTFLAERRIREMDSELPPGALVPLYRAVADISATQL